jgi:8-oxo-dGTP pyrophosphatase MutT (NUDIX family)
MTDSPASKSATSNSPLSDSADPNKIPVGAATVVLIRDGDHGPEVLLARRNSRLFFAGGAWVFPGGRIDLADHGEDYPGVPFDESDPRFIEVARRACVREAAEEADALIAVEDLVWMSHWTPPMEAPKRFSTFFFIGPAPEHVLTADGGEIHELAWMAPADAMTRRNVGEIELIPPTFITLALLSRFADVASALAHYASHAPEHFVTQFASVDGTAIAMYDEDAGYATGDPSLPGARHRLWMGEGDWIYERSEWPN